MTKVQPEPDFAKAAESPKTAGYYQAVRRIPWSVRAVAALALLSLVLWSVPSGRRSVLRFAGSALVREDQIRTADAIVVAVDARDPGVVEAADLVRRGMSHSVALFATAPDEVDLELARRGIENEDQVSRQTRLLRALGVDRVERIPLSIEGTEDEGRVLPGWCDARGLRSVIVVASPDHSRRIQRVLRRSMKGHATAVMVRKARYAEFDPERWWLTRDGVRTGVVELEKLLFDFVRHPIS